VSLRPRVWALLFVAGAALGAGCRFERRPDLAAEEPIGGTLYAPTGDTGAVEDSVRATMVAVSEAFRVGDVARVAQLTTRDAVLIDQEDEVRWTRTDAAAQLPRPLMGGAEGLAWTLASSSFTPLSEGAALVALAFQASVAGETVPWSAVESWVLVRTEAGWRLRYLHRSRGLGPSDPLP
jgi:ketosteroid isomerase-like protein